MLGGARLKSRGRPELIACNECRWAVSTQAELMNVSRHTPSRWRRHWRAYGDAGMTDRGTRPRDCITNEALDPRQPLRRLRCAERTVCSPRAVVRRELRATVLAPDGCPLDGFGTKRAISFVRLNHDCSALGDQFLP